LAEAGSVLKLDGLDGATSSFVEGITEFVFTSPELTEVCNLGIIEL
jgi:hypothetical protein